jgi:hypothetical protein
MIPSFMHNFIWNHIGKGTKKASPFGKLTHEELASKSLKAISYELEDICTNCRGQFPSYVVGANLEAVPESNNIFDKDIVGFLFPSIIVQSNLLTRP